MINKVIAEKIKQEFIHAWNGYMKYASGHDGLKPLSKSYYEYYDESLVLTAIDAVDTMVIMDLKEQLEEAKQMIFENLSFDKDIFVQIFEINIRVLGGLLAAFQMDGDKRFLEFAEDLAKRLLSAFKSKTGLPYRFINLKTGETKDGISNPAESGTFLIEFGTLSKLTNNPIYYETAKKALRAIFKRRSKLNLVGKAIDVETGEWKDSESYVGSRIDSYYEYLWKSWLLFKDEECKNMYNVHIEAVNKYVADDNQELWYKHVDMNTGETLKTHYGALDAFFPGLLAISNHLEKAKRLQDSSFKMWNLHQLEPEVLDYTNMEVIMPAYRLRPELAESAYYLYHFTKDEKYLEMGKTIFESIVKYCKTDEGYTELADVRTKEKEDYMSSYLLAETFKYLYLLFSPEDTLEFDKFVFSTEAHLFKK